MKNEKNNGYGALFILYNPKTEELERINNLAIHFDTVYVYDNSESNKSLRSFFKLQNIIYLWNNKNNGLAIPYNYVLEKAYESKIRWLSLFDQDSIVTDNLVLGLRIHTYQKIDSNIAVIAPRIQYDDNNVANRNNQFVDWVINSGQMINVVLVKQNNIKYDENYFLDRLDADFCMQLKLKKLLILQVGNVFMKQNLGEIYKGYTIHSPVRNYYMFRNRLYFNKKFYHFPISTILNFIQSMKHISSILIIRKDVIKNLKMIKIALRDYKNKEFGAISKRDK